MIKTQCANCSKELWRIPSRLRPRNYCNAKCQSTYEYANGIKDKNTIANAAHTHNHQKTIDAWNAGKPYKYVNKRGYIQVLTPSGFVPEHHLIWAKYNAGFVHIPKGMVVHHINRIKTDNRIENLCLMPADYHHKLHYAMRRKDEQGRLLAV